MSRALAFADVQALLARVPALQGIVLVGGQALNYWAERFALDEEAALSFDIDFLGSARHAEQFARGIGGRVQVASLSDVNTPNTALVDVEFGGERHLIDFLDGLHGFTQAEIERVRAWAVQVRVKHDAPPLAVMHPVHSLESVLANVYGLTLDRRARGERYVGRVRIAVEATRRITLEYIEQNLPREALTIAEAVFEAARREPALRARVEDGVDVRTAVPVESMPVDFVEKRLPQLQARDARALQKYQRLREKGR